MSKDDVSRRCVLGALSVGAAGAAVAAVPRVVTGATPAPVSADGEQTSTSTSTSAGSPPTASAAELCAPLVAGSTLGRWTIEQLFPVEGGAATVVLSDANGERFQIDICARDQDPAACRGPGSTERFDLIVANLGDGNTSTHEDHGLAAMALAEIVRANEHGVDASAFRTLRQRLEADSVRRVVT